MEPFFCFGYVFALMRAVATVLQATAMLPPSSSNLPSVEIEALQSLYNSTNGSNWAWGGNSVRWNFSGNPNPCSEGWYGVHCTSVPSGGYLHVRELALSAWNLTGTLPEELAQFEELNSLDLSVNRISGTLPPELSNLMQLQILHLYTNYLTGTLPPELGNLTLLEIFALNTNGLTGTLPPELGKLTQLQYLGLESNHLTGTLPPELGKLAQLQVFNLYYNYLTGTLPPELGNLTLLEILTLGSNGLTGTLPPELGKLTQLQCLGLDFNPLTGTLPPELGNLTLLEILTLHTDGLTGTLPPELGNLMQLHVLNLVVNELTGTLPPELGKLTQVQYLDVSINHLTGPLPPELGSLTQLQYLSLDTNYLTGTLPPELGSLTQLQYLYLGTNYLIGTVPPELGSLTQLQDLYLGINHLTGTLPPELGNLTQLQYHQLNTNHLTGTLPPELGSLTQLQGLYLYTNHLTGTLPPELGSLTQLQELNLNTNQLTGTLPPELSNLMQLEYLELQVNHLIGTLSPELGNLTQMKYFELQVNHLTGTLPPKLGNLAQLLILNLDSNQLTGTLPPELGNQAQLRNLNLDNNQLTGTLPPELGNLAMLLNIDLGNNLFIGILSVVLKPTLWPYVSAINLGGNAFTGTILTSLFHFSVLQYLDLSNNMFTGTLSSDLENAKELVYLSVADNHLWGCLPRVPAGGALQEIDVSNNQLRCSLDGVFDSVVQNSSLLNVQLGGNQFTGTLPAVLFYLRKLQTLVAVSNCFTGTLPQEICQATALQSLILDGVGASRSCPTMWTTWQREGQLRIPNRFHGTIPECVFSLPELTSMHLSGNNLIGTIPDRVTLGGNLTQLYLSHNFLTGSIPEAVQTHSWDQLDISYNRFSGSLLPSFGEGTLQGPFNATASVVVNNSRLSGEIPATVLQLPLVSMLGTNMFSCKADKSDVPNTDGNGDKQRYQCGSDSFNYAFYLFLGITGVAAGALFAVCRTFSNAMLMHAHELLLRTSSFPASCEGIFATISVLTQIAVCCCVPLLLVLVPWYSAASHYYGTYTHQYAWVVSAAFLSGLAPGLVEFFLWSGTIVLVAWLSSYFTSSNLLFAAEVDEGESVPSSNISLAARTQAYALFLGVNLLGVIGANVAFVYVSLNESSEAVLLAQVALSLFKFGWNTIGVPYLLEWISQHLVPVKGSSGFFRVQCFIGLFNNIAIPCLVVAAESPSCFRDLLFPPAAVTSDFAIQGCQVVNYDHESLIVDCSHPLLYPQQSSFVPQFSYSYECSSSFVTYYSAAMVYFALTAAVLVPAVRLLLCWVVHCTPAESRIYQWSNAALPKLWRVPVKSGDADVQSSRRISYVNVDNLLVNMTVYLGIFLSFGVVFPPVALAMCVAMLSTAYQTRLAVGRLLFNAREVGAQHVVEAVEQDCRGVASLEKLQSMIRMVIVFACYFYALFIFDTIGDAEGFAGACWVLALWVVVPLCATAYIRYRRYARSAVPTRRNVSLSVVGPSVELLEIQNKGKAAKSRVLGMEEGDRQAGALVGEEGTVSALHA